MLNSELVKRNIEDSIPVSRAFLDDSKTSTHYFSGRKIELGDKLSFAFFHKEIQSGDTIEVNVSMITYHPEEYNTIYEDAQHLCVSEKFPSFKLKK